ncbi:MAG: phosphate signaling complex protein PhoU, partial [Thermicanus sp.]|nr:phosphate signaling complex protein PhoU [Thermicanus sp.]
MVRRKQFDEQLEDLHRDLVAMGTLVEEAIHKSLKSVIEKDIALAERVIADDARINDLELKIEKGCFSTIALQQPLGSDLRRIGTMLKVSTDIERMGDHAVTIAKAAIRLQREIYVKPLVDIPKLGELVKKMVREALTAYISGDVEEARRIAKGDDEVDHLYRLIITDAIEIMSSNEKLANQGSQFLFI